MEPAEEQERQRIAQEMKAGSEKLRRALIIVALAVFLPQIACGVYYVVESLRINREVSRQSGR